MNNKKKKIITILGLLTIIFTMMGTTLAIWNWQTEEEQRTLVTFTATSEFSCSADGGGNITPGSIVLVPTEVNENTTNNYIKREIRVNPMITSSGKTIYMDLWLDVVNLDSGLANNDNFKYVLSTSSTSIDDEYIVTSGDFQRTKTGDKVMLLDQATYTQTDTDTYYLYIWLDKEEYRPIAMNQTFELRLNGECSDIDRDTLNGIDSIETLQNKYNFTYYSTLSGAVNDVNNGTIGVNANSNKANAVSGIYTDNGETYVVLLKDTTENERVQPAVDMTINLGGHILNSINQVGIDILSGNVTIDGRLEGSTVQITHTDGSYSRPIQTKLESDVIINGGNYICHTENVTASGGNMCIRSSGNIIINNISIISTETTGNSRGISVSETGYLTIINSNIKTESSDGYSQGIYVPFGATVTISNSNIETYSNQIGNYATGSRGIENYGILTLNNSYIMGEVGVFNMDNGTLYVNGGIYEGYLSGGIRFGGGDTSATAYVRDAVIREREVPEGYTIETPDKVGVTIGGTNNASIYMDNCDIYGSDYPIDFRNNTQNNSLYISNSRINTDGIINIGNDTHKLYIGSGNNFTASNTNRPSSVITTNEIYRVE